MKKVFLFIILSIISHCCVSQILPFIGDDMEKVFKKWEVLSSIHNSEGDSLIEISSSESSISIVGYMNDENSKLETEKHIYEFSENICSIYYFKHPDLFCGGMYAERTFLKGKWRKNSKGQLINRRKSIIAEVRQINEAPFNFEIKFIKKELKISRKEFKEMEKVEKDLIRTTEYLIK